MRVAEAQDAAQNQDSSTARQILRACLEEHADELLSTVRLYVAKAKFASREVLEDVAAEVFTEVAAQVLASADRFDPARRPYAWILGVAGNVVKRRQAEFYRQAQREQLITDLNLDPDAADISDSELFDRLATINLQAFDQIATDPPESTYETQEILAVAIGQLSPDDRTILRLALKHEFDCNLIASELDIKSGAARVRLSRAIQRLRTGVNKPGDDNHD